MANSAQARKRARQSLKNRAHNASLRTAFRTAVKKVLKAVEAGDKAAAQAVYRESTKFWIASLIKACSTKTKRLATKAVCRQKIKQVVLNAC